MPTRASRMKPATVSRACGRASRRSGSQSGSPNSLLMAPAAHVDLLPQPAVGRHVLARGRGDLQQGQRCAPGGGRRRGGRPPAAPAGPWSGPAGRRRAAAPGRATDRASSRERLRPDLRRGGGGEFAGGDLGREDAEPHRAGRRARPGGRRCAPRRRSSTAEAAKLSRSAAVWKPSRSAASTSCTRPRMPGRDRRRLRRREGHVQEEAGRVAHAALAQRAGQGHQVVVVHPDPVVRPQQRRQVVGEAPVDPAVGRRGPGGGRPSGAAGCAASARARRWNSRCSSRGARPRSGRGWRSRPRPRWAKAGRVRAAR